MQTSELLPTSRLYGARIFLSASIPSPERKDQYERVADAPLRIEESVVSIARAIFIESGTLVFGAHPSISPLVARVADHYYLPAPAEQNRTETKNDEEVRWMNPSVVIYQSRVWEPSWAEATERLTRHPLVQVQWVDAAPGEKIDPDNKDRPQALASMAAMRRAMIEETSPVAMIAVGGMKGVLDEASLFTELRPGKPIFVLATTGGAAAALAQKANSDNVQIVDAGAEELVSKFWERQKAEDGARRDNEQEQKHYVPYAFIAQQIVKRILDLKI